jgi:hypothetical protein
VLINCSFDSFPFPSTDFQSVTRGCRSDELQSPGCQYDDQGQYVCVYLCDTDLCNGAGVLPPAVGAGLCYSCSGSYASSACGYNFNADLVSKEVCDESCATVMTGETIVVGF